MTNNANEARTPDEERAILERQQQVVSRTMGQIEDATEALGGISRQLGGVLVPYISDQPLGLAVDGLADLSSRVDKLEKALSEVKARISYAKEVSMPNRMDAEACKTFNTDHYRVTRTARVFASITAAQTEDAYEWLRQNGFESLIKETVNSSSLSSAAKEMMGEGMEMPEDLFKVHMKDGISITKK